MWKQDLPTTTALAILGLLSKRSMSGYELTGFAAESVGHFWPMHRSLVYRELIRLETAGYVSGMHVPQERVPDKRTYKLTENGIRVLDEWLVTPGFQRAHYRDEFLVKFFFSARVDLEHQRNLLDEYRLVQEREISYLRAIVKKTESIPGAVFGRLSARHGIRTREALLDWIAEVEEVLRAGLDDSLQTICVEPAEMQEMVEAMPPAKDES